MNRKLLTLFVIVFVDLLGFGLILPLLPYYAATYNASEFLTGLLTASYAAAQFLGAPVLGRLSDRMGRRPILLVSIFGTFLGFLLLGFAPLLGAAISSIAPALITVNGAVLGIMFISRMLDGLTGGNISVAQAYIADVTDAQNRARGLGIIGAAFGLGFIIGPAAGGALSRFGYSVPAFAAATLSMINLLLVVFWLPESLSAEKRAELAVHPRTAFSLSQLGEALQKPKFGPLLHIRIMYALAFSLFQSIFSLYAKGRLGLDSPQTGYVLAYVGLLSVLVQGVAIGRLVKRYRESQLIFAGLGLLGLCLLGWAFAPNLVVLLIVLAPMSLATGVLNTVINSSLSKSVAIEEIGGALGLSASLESLTRVIAPVLGGALLQWIGFWSPGVFSALIVAWVFWFTWRHLIHVSDGDEVCPVVGAR